MPPTRRSLQDRWSRMVATARAHPWVTAVLALGVVVSVVLSVLVGLDLIVTFGLLAIVGGGAVGLRLLWTRRRPQDPPRSAAATGRMALVFVACSGLLTFAVIQLVPYGRAHANPPVTDEPEWADDRTRELMVTACFSCHSNEVEYPPYASVAPVSWLVQRHVDEGRSKVNYSEFATDPGEADESVEVVEEGEMPPAYFTRFGLHADSDLTAAEVEELIDGLRATPGMDGD